MKYLTLAESTIDVPLIVLLHDNGFPLDGNHLGGGVVYPHMEVPFRIEGTGYFGADLMLAEPCMTPVVSGRLLQRLQEEQIETGQLIPLNEIPLEGFAILNPIGLEDLISQKESISLEVAGVRMYMKVVLNKYRGPDALIRIRGYSAFPFLTDRTAAILCEYSHPGIGFGEFPEVE